MKRAKRNELQSEYRRENLGRGIRGKYLKAYRSGTNLVRLEPEVAAVFRTDKDVNRALSSLIDVAKRARPTKRSGQMAKATRN